MKKILTDYKKNITPPYSKKDTPAFFLTIAVAISLLLTIRTLVHESTIYQSNASTTTNSIELENGTASGNVSVINDSNASGGKYIVLGSANISPTSLPMSTPTPSQSLIDPAPPIPPQSYTLPASAVRVTNSSQLNTALSGSTVDIILADGIYANSSAFQGRTHHLWAEHLGGATLTAGISFNGDNGEVHGLKIDISAGGAIANEAVLYSEGNRLKAYDSWITGRTNVRYLSGIRSHGNDGVDIRRVVLRNATYNGIMLTDDQVNYTPAVASYISDVDIYGVSDPNPGSLDGTAEAAIWVEHTITVERVKIRHVSWMGFATEVNVNDSIFRDLDIDDIYGGGKGGGIAFYIEHWTRRSTIEKFHFGPKIVEGLQSEWDAPEWNNTGAGTDNMMRNGTIDSTRDGAYPDEGTLRMTLQNIIFKNQSYAAIVDKGTNTVISGNDYRGIKPGAVQISHEQGW